MQFPTFSLLFLSILSVAFAAPVPATTSDIATDITTDIVEPEARDLESRGGKRFTYYDTSVGLGACGKWNPNDKYTVALPSSQFGNGSKCGKKIKVNYGGKSITATVQDECPGCPKGALDLSMGAFKGLAPLSKGVVYGNWNY